MDITQDLDEVLANQLDIARQCIDERDKRIFELQTRVELLEQMLNRAAAQRFHIPRRQGQCPAHDLSPPAPGQRPGRERGHGLAGNHRHGHGASVDRVS